ncbi:hypothetical protein VYJ29_004333 [Yersinia enterocolitica]|nr:hypothetical protein [Yersinia enterocolitica]EKN3769511.1 hypothetical protein [Yersinia enterocolitica]EKN3890706.1 hypothetical protein [Yersinia enterocolitica]EKN4084656.1 hypothetical protein [Yersinia enterocolitica]ELI7913337.1 hypothetical protein [Yersinia enterocolitica]
MKYIDPFHTLPQYKDKTQLLRTWKIARRVITPGQQVWTKYLLMLWGRHLGGDDSHELDGGQNVIGRLMVRTAWSADRSDQIIRIVKMLHEDGLRGDELYRRSRELALPETSVSNIIALAKESDDAAFVEKVMCKALNKASPMRAYAIKRYCDRKYPQILKRELVRLTGCSDKEARNRVEWCEEILEVEMFYAFKREMEKEFLINCH